MADLASKITDLKADFQRIVGYADWVRSCFTVNARKFGLFGFGRPGGDGDSEAVIIAEGDPFLSELHALTDQAGSLLAEMLQAERLKVKGFSQSPNNYHLQQPWQVRLVFLLHSPLTLGHCCAKRPDGLVSFAAPQIGEGITTVWIDKYPQVCVAALASVKADLLAGTGRQRTPKNPASLRNAARDAWVARLRAKTNPPSWEEIYDEGVRLAAKRGWEMPGSAKALEEAYRRHLKRQRTATQD